MRPSLNESNFMPIFCNELLFSNYTYTIIISGKRIGIGIIIPFIIVHVLILKLHTTFIIYKRILFRYSFFYYIYILYAY